MAGTSASYDDGYVKSGLENQIYFERGKVAVPGLLELLWSFFWIFETMLMVFLSLVLWSRGRGRLMRLDAEDYRSIVPSWRNSSWAFSIEKMDENM